MRLVAVVALPLLALVAALGACATAGSDGGGGSGGAGGASGAGGAGGGSGGLLLDSGTGGNAGSAATVYAHTDKTLFSIDPTSAAPDLKQLGNFDCVGGSGQDPAMTDVAVDKNGKLWGISHTQVHELEVVNKVVHCAKSIPLNAGTEVKFYALTFAPVGVISATEEVLVAGNTAGELWAIDSSGNLSQRGVFGDVPISDGNGHVYASEHQGKAWELSGDIVFVENDGNPIGFATVRDCPNPPATSSCNGTDTLIEIDVPKLAKANLLPVTKAVRGQIVKRGSCADAANTAYGSMYGITTWGDRVYGFSRTGNLVEIDTNDGSACLLAAFPGADFGGAGVTTKAVVTPPPPK
jgi:hypothetical protein